VARSRLGFVLRQVAHDVDASLLFRPALVTAALAGLAFLVIGLDLPEPSAGSWARIFVVEPAAAQSVLSVIAGSMMSVVSIVYAVLLMALTMASMQFSPRILGGFMKDRVSQTTLGVFIGSFVYCLVIMRAITTEPAWVPPYAVTVAMLLVLCALAMLAYFIHHIASGIQANNIVDRIARETRAAMDDMAREAAAYRGVEAPAADDDVVEVPARAVGYTQLVDHEGLLELAARHDLVIEVVHPPGDFVARGVPLARVSPSRRVSPAVAEAIAGAFDIGAVRTLQQDVLFGFRQIVDIALKAISPAINDPSTAATCIDHLGALLAELLRQPPLPAAIAGPQGRGRVTLHPPCFDEALTLVTKQLRQYGRGDMSVAVRLLGALEQAALAAREAAQRRAISEQAELLAESLADHFRPEDRATFERRLAELRARLTPG